MAEPHDPPNLPGSERKADDLARALKRAAAQPRDRQDEEIAADDAGASTLAETPKPKA